MTEIRNKKEEHKRYAKRYIDGGKEVLIRIIRENWNSVVTYLYEDVKDNPSINTKLLLSNIIAERLLIARNSGKLKHMAISVVGMAGSGKTTYVVRSGIGALMISGMKYEDALSMTEKLVFFEPYSLITFIKELLVRRKWVPFIIIDDIGSQISKYWVFLGQKYWSYLFSVLDQLKDIVGVLISTARSFDNIPNRIREISDIVADMVEVDLGGVIVDRIEFYKQRDYKKSGKEKKMLFLDAIPPTAKMPDELWKRMMETRRKIGIARIEEIEKLYVDKILYGGHENNGGEGD